MWRTHGPPSRRRGPRRPRARWPSWTPSGTSAASATCVRRDSSPRPTKTRPRPPMTPPTLFTIAQDLTKMQVDTNVDEADVSRVRVGQRVTFTVDSFPGQSFTGEVVQIRKAPQVLQNVVTYDVVVSAQNLDLRLLPGMTANVRIVTDQKADVLRVPNAALRFRPPGDRK